MLAAESRTFTVARVVQSQRNAPKNGTRLCISCPRFNSSAPSLRSRREQGAFYMPQRALI